VLISEVVVEGALMANVGGTGTAWSWPSYDKTPWWSEPGSPRLPSELQTDLAASMQRAGFRMCASHRLDGPARRANWW